MDYQNRIVICGSAHSGKTVFSTNLYQLLPQKYTFMIRACPDGEGVYSNNKEQEVIGLTRRKGEMSQEFVKEMKARIEKETAPIVLVDVGGLRSKENEEIFRQCNSAIILDKSEEGIEDWKEFCQSQGLEILAEIKSIRGKNVKSEIFQSKPSIVGTVANLERGEDKSKDATILALRKRLYEIAIEKGLIQKGKEALRHENVFDMSIAAKRLKMKKEGNIRWQKEKAKEIYYYARGSAYQKKELNIFESRANWVTGLVCKAAEDENVQDIALYDARLNQYIKTEKLNVDAKKQGESLKEIEKYYVLSNKINLYMQQEEEEIMMQFELNPKSYIKVEDKKDIILPPVDPNKKIYISGKLPLWLFASISRTYKNIEKSVLQPGIGFIQYSSKESKNLGKTEKELRNIDFGQFLKMVKEDVEIGVEGEGR